MNVWYARISKSNAHLGLFFWGREISMDNSETIYSNAHVNALLRQWRERNGITVDELAIKLGYHIVSVSQYLSGSREITDRFIGAFTRVYGPTAAAEAFGLSDAPQREPVSS